MIVRNEPVVDLVDLPFRAKLNFPHIHLIFLLFRQARVFCGQAELLEKTAAVPRPLATEGPLTALTVLSVHSKI